MVSAKTLSSSDDIYICALVSYDGTCYNGSQYQPNAPTIQGELEKALYKLLGTNYRIVASGRTDTGVHALGQVISVRLSWRHSLSRLQQAWTHYLPNDIAIRRLSLAPDGFHPRYSAYSRTYRYTVIAQAKPANYVAPKFLPLNERFALYLPMLIDVDLMNRVAQDYLIGEHDFAAFGTDPHGDNTIRQIFQANWRRIDDSLALLDKVEQSEIAVFTITATAFLRRMVRNLVGTLLEVGMGKRTSEDVYRILQSKDRSQSAPPVLPQGLVLERVDYPDYPDLFGGER